MIARAARLAASCCAPAAGERERPRAARAHRARARRRARRRRRAGRVLLQRAGRGELRRGPGLRRRGRAGRERRDHPTRRRSEAIAVSLPADLPDGTYTATYRVISADSHPVSGGFVFTRRQGRARRPAETVSELLDEQRRRARSPRSPSGRRAGSATRRSASASALSPSSLIWRGGAAPAGGAERELDRGGRSASPAAPARCLLVAAAIGPRQQPRRARPPGRDRGGHLVLVGARSRRDRRGARDPLRSADRRCAPCAWAL